MEDKYKKIISRVKNDDLFLDDLIDGSDNYLEKALEAKDLTQGALGAQYLKDTGVSIPDIKRASRSQIESFVNKLKEEAYPELRKNDISLMEGVTDFAGQFDPNTGGIKLNKTYLDTPEKLVGTAFHELGHGYDELKGTDIDAPVDIWTPEKKKLLKNLGINKGSDLTKLDSSAISEIMHTGHHTNIPKLREGSFGLGALKSLLKNKTFKSAVPFIGPAIAGGATMLATGDASAALQEATPILGEAGNLGPEQGSLEEQVENPQVSPEQRRKAIETLMKMNNQ